MQMLTSQHLWTADDLDRLPDDDGNKYEVVAGRLLVTPAPSLAHEVVLNMLRRRIEAYVDAAGIGTTFSRNDLKFDKQNRVDPDLSVVRVALPVGELTWRDVPHPMLVVEVLSRSTRTHDLVWKAALYAREQIPLAWIVDHRERVVHVVRPGHPVARQHAVLQWHPEGAPAPLSIDLAALFDGTVGPRA